MKVMLVSIVFYSFYILNPFLSFAETLEDEKENIRRTVFQYLFKNNESHLKQTAAAYCLSIEGDIDPSKKLIDRILNNFPLVKRMSDCERQASVEPKKYNVVIVDKKTRKRALRFEVREIVWTNNTEVVVKAGYYEHSLSASLHSITLKKANSQWKVEGDKLLVIS